MGNINSFNSFMNESNAIKITSDNFIEYKDKLLALVSNEDDSNLKKGYEFVVANLNDYEDDSFVRNLCDTFFNTINNLISKKYKSFWKEEDKGYSGHKFTGDRYKATADLDVKELSKLIKKELTIEYPEWKFSVKIDRFSGGQSINVTIMDMPYTPYTEEVGNAYKNNTQINTHRRDEIYNELYLKDYDKIKKIIDQYNYDDSEAMTDYFSVRYYSHLSLSDYDIKKKYYPENADVKRHDEFSKAWEEKTKKRKEIADSKKGNYKKGESVIFIYDKESAIIPKGEYKAIILKVPNGRAMFSKYEIRFWVDKRKKNGEIETLEKPIAYLTSVYNEKDLKKIENIQESYHDTDYLSNRERERDTEIKKKVFITKGYWVNFNSEYGDVWHEVIDTYSPDDWYGTVYYYDQVSTKSNESKREMSYYYNIRKVSEKLPNDARCIFCSTGSFSERRGNLSQYKK